MVIISWFSSFFIMAFLLLFKKIRSRLLIALLIINVSIYLGIYLFAGYAKSAGYSDWLMAYGIVPFVNALFSIIAVSYGLVSIFSKKQ